jgi:hypothetical protein
MNLEEPKDLASYLSQSLVNSGQEKVLFWSNSITWYADLLGLGFDKIPFFLVHDIGNLFLLGKKFRFANSEDSLRSKYIFNILNKIWGSFYIDEINDILNETKSKDSLIVFFLETVLKPFDFSEFPSILFSPSIVRNLGYDLPQESSIDSQHFEELLEKVLSLFYKTNFRKLIKSEDLFIARHFDLLGTHSERIAEKQVLECEKSYGAAPPIPPDFQKESPDVMVDLEDSGLFPQGGLDELSTRGVIENLVRSELVYMEKDSQEVDLFTLKFMEGEILYYTRDEGQLLRKSRTIHFFFENSDQFRSKLPHLKARSSIILTSWVQRCASDIFHLLQTEAVRIVFHAVGPEGELIASHWKVRFAEAIQNGWVEVHTHETLPSFDKLLEKGRQCYLVYIGKSELDVKSLPIELRVHQIHPSLKEESKSGIPLNLNDIKAQDLSDLRTSLVWSICV